MPDSILYLILAAVAVLALVDVVLGRALPDHYGDEGLARIGLFEFATRPLPIFLFGVGAAMLPVRPMAGVGLLSLAGGLALLGRNVRREQA